MKRNVILLFGLFGIGLIMVSVAAFVFVSGKPNPALSTMELTVGNRRFMVELAQTPLEHSRGLSGRAPLAENQGMLFIFHSAATRSFWMKGMQFPLDIIWIRDGAIIGTDEHVPPPAPGSGLASLKMYSSPESADMVLEVNAGVVARYGLKVGDSVVLQ